MPLTRAFKKTVQARMRQGRKYREELLREGVECPRPLTRHALPVRRLHQAV